MNAIEMVQVWLEINGYDGLYNSFFDCSCPLDDLNPSEFISASCEAAYRFDCDKCTKASSCDLSDSQYPTYALTKDYCQPEYRED